MSSTDKDIKQIASLFEQLLGDPEEFAKRPTVADAALAAAHLSATLDAVEPESVPNAGAGDPIALVAGYLDGGIEDQERRKVEASLATSPAELHDAAASLSFLDDIAARTSAAPADLVDTAITELRAAQPVAARQTARRRFGWSVRAWQWSGALAAVLILIAIGLDRIGQQAPKQFTTIPSSPNTASVRSPAETNTVQSEPAPDDGSPEAKAAGESGGPGAAAEKQAASDGSPGAGCAPPGGSEVQAAGPGTGKAAAGITGDVAGTTPCDTTMNAARLVHPPNEMAGQAAGASLGSKYPAAAMPLSPTLPSAAPPGSRN